MPNKTELFYDQTNDYAVRRFINQAAAAEGTSLPPKQFGEFRVPFISSLLISRIQPRFNQTIFTLTWLDAPAPNVSHYNIYAYGAVDDNRQPLGPATTKASPCIFPIAATNNSTPITFVVQTVLSNGQVSTLDRSPAVTGITQVSEVSGGDIEAGSVPISALANSTPGNIITWDGSSLAVSVTKSSADIVIGSSNLTTANEIVIVSAAGEVTESGIDIATLAGFVSGATNLTTAGAVPFTVSSGTLTDDPSNLFYDDTSNALGVGTNAPAATIHAQQATLGTAVQQLSSTASNSDPTEVVVQNKVLTTDATATTIHTIPIPASTTVGWSGTVVARRTGGVAGTAEDGAYYEISGVYKNVAGTATAVGVGALITLIGEDQILWNVTYNVSTSNVQIQVTGAASNNVSWATTLRIYSVSS